MIVQTNWFKGVYVTVHLKATKKPREHLIDKEISSL